MTSAPSPALPPVLILGARSDMARACAHGFAERGHPIQLAARDPETLTEMKTDLELRYRVAVTTHAFDVLDLDSHAAFLDGLPDDPRIALCAVGIMGEQTDNEVDMAAHSRVLRTNFEGPANIFAHLANRFAKRGSGTIIGISSVAGLRGRATNYIYGSAKAGFTAYLSGLRNRLTGLDVHVVTVLPGFVNTAMTADLDLPEKLTAEPEEVAKAVLRAVDKKKNVIYVRPIWQLVMTIICNIPEPVFKKLKI